MEFAAGEVFARHSLRFAILAGIEELEPLPSSGVFEVLHGCRGVCDLGGDECGGVGFFQGGKGEPHHNRSASNQRGAPDQVRPCAGLETAYKHIDCGRDADDPATDRDRAEIEAKERLALEEDRNDFGAGVDDGCGRHTHEDDQTCERHDEARERAVAILKKLGNGVDAAAQELRQEDERNNNKSDGGHPFIRGDRHSKPIRRRPRHSNELLGRDVCRDEREANEPPGESPPRKEISGCSAGVLVIGR